MNGAVKMTRTRLDDLKDEVFNVVSETVNTKWHAISHISIMSDISQSIPHPRSFEIILANKEFLYLPKGLARSSLLMLVEGAITSSTPKKSGTMWGNSTPVTQAQKCYPVVARHYQNMKRVLPHHESCHLRIPKDEGV